MIDECHNFLNLPYRIEDMLAEARGFRVGLTLAHQNLAQLPPELREGINTNARNKIMFSVSPDDATHLARHTLPELSPHDLAHLDAFHAAARLLHHGAETRAFTLTTRPLPTVRRAASCSGPVSVDPPPVACRPSSAETTRRRTSACPIPPPLTRAAAVGRDQPPGSRSTVSPPTKRPAENGSEACYRPAPHAVTAPPHTGIAVRCHPDLGVVHRVGTSAAYLVASDERPPNELQAVGSAATVETGRGAGWRMSARQRRGPASALGASALHPGRRSGDPRGAGVVAAPRRGGADGAVHLPRQAPALLPRRRRRDRRSRRHGRRSCPSPGRGAAPSGRHRRHLPEISSSGGSPSSAGVERCCRAPGTGGHGTAALSAVMWETNQDREVAQRWPG